MSVRTDVIGYCIVEPRVRLANDCILEFVIIFFSCELYTYVHNIHGAQYIKKT